jgi:hypothetical protein
MVVNRWPLSAQVKSEPDHRWQDAMTIPLGKTIFASGDDEEYIPLPGTPRKALPELADWYKFEFSSDKPALVFFQIDLMERDQIPVDVRVYRVANGKIEEYYEGEDSVTLPHHAFSAASADVRHAQRLFGGHAAAGAISERAVL